MLRAKTKQRKPTVTKTSRRRYNKRSGATGGSTAGSAAGGRKQFISRDLQERGVDTSSAAQPQKGKFTSGPSPRASSTAKMPTSGEKQRYQQLQEQKLSKHMQQQQQQQQQANNAPGFSNDPSNKKTLTQAMAPTMAARKANDLTGVPLTDFDTMFKNSRLSNLFSHEQSHHSFFSRMDDGDTVYLMGSRRLVDPHGRAADTNFCLLQRTLDKENKRLLDRLVALDYDSGLPFEQHLTTQLEDDLTKATAIDKDQESGDVISRTFVRLRGEPFKWHSAVAMSKIEPRVDLSTMSQEYLDSLPQTYAISRLKFGENGLISEKLIRQNDQIVLTVVDELKVTTQKIFESRIEKIFKEYSNMLTNEIENAAQHLGDDEAANMELLDQFREPEGDHRGGSRRH